MPTNDILPFGTGVGANVLDQASYAALAGRTAGFSAGTAISAQLNKVWRQSSFAAATLGQFVADYSGDNVVDNGTISAFEASLVKAIKAQVGPQLATLKAMTNVQTINNTTRTTVAGSGANVYTTALSGTITKASATSKLVVWVTNPIYYSTTGPTAIRLVVDSGTAYGLTSPATPGQSYGQTALNTIFTGLGAGTLSWTLAYARGDATAWTSTCNPTTTDQTYYPTASTTGIIYGEIEP